MNTKSSIAIFVLGGAVLAQPAAAQYMDGGPWSGFYIGGHAGEAFKPNKLEFTDLSTAQDLSVEANNSGNTFLGGAQAGYDWQAGGVLVGFEGDVSFAKDIDYLASARGRLGFPLGRFLIYGTGGAAFEGAKEQFTVFSLSPGIFPFRHNINKTGWTAGGGIDFMVFRGISLGVEGLYYGMGRDQTALVTDDSLPESFAVNDDRNFAVVRARLTYHFGW